MSKFLPIIMLLTACGEHSGSHGSWDCEGPWFLVAFIVTYGTVALHIWWEQRAAKPESVAAIYQKGYETGFTKGEQIGHAKGLTEGMTAFSNKADR